MHKRPTRRRKKHSSTSGRKPRENSTEAELRPGTTITSIDNRLTDLGGIYKGGSIGKDGSWLKMTDAELEQLPKDPFLG